MFSAENLILARGFECRQPTEEPTVADHVCFSIWFLAVLVGQPNLGQTQVYFSVNWLQFDNLVELPGLDPRNSSNVW